jgi:hypothetical protein
MIKVEFNGNLSQKWPYPLSKDEHSFQSWTIKPSRCTAITIVDVDTIGIPQNIIFALTPTRICCKGREEQHQERNKRVFPPENEEKTPRDQWWDQICGHKWFLVASCPFVAVKQQHQNCVARIV